MPRGPSEQLAPTLSKRSRTSGKHSRNGCGTCKIRRVKCDETRPVCRRCQNFKIVCDGYRRTPGTPDFEFQSRPPSLAPKPRVSSTSPSPSPSTLSMPSSPSALIVDDAEEYRYFTYFKDNLLFEITQSTKADTFRTLILQASIIPSIRHAMIALSALGKTHSILEQEKTASLLIPESLEFKVHRDYSLRRYAKALASMKQAIAAGDQELRITTLTCLLIVCIECLHGNFAMADVQVSNGMALLREWREGFPNANDHPIGFSSPAPYVVEDSLVQMLGGLEIQSPSFIQEIPQDGHQIDMEEGQNIITNMPMKFQSLEESRIYLELLIRRSNRWLTSMGACPKPLSSVSTSVPSVQLTPPVDTSNFNSFILPSSDRRYVDYVDSLSEPSQHAAITSQQALYLKDLHRWKASFDALTAPNLTISTHPTFKDQLLAFKCCILTLKTTVSGSETVFYDYTEDLADILDVAESVQDDVGDQENVTAFTIYQRLTGPPYFVGLHCKIGPIRRRGLELLNSLPKTGMSDSVLMDAIIRWVMGLEEEETLEGQTPDYSRVRNMSVTSVSSNASRRSSTIIYDYEIMTDQEFSGTEKNGSISC